MVPIDELLFDNVFRVRTLVPLADASNRHLASLNRDLASRALWPPMHETLLRFGLEFPARAFLIAVGVGWVMTPGPRRVVGAFVCGAALGLPWVVSFTGGPGASPLLDLSWTPKAWLCVGVLALLAHWRHPTLRTGALAIAATTSAAMALRWKLDLAWVSYHAPFAPMLILLTTREIAGLSGRTRAVGVGAALVVAVATVGTTVVGVIPYYERQTYELRFPRGTIRTTPREGTAMGQVIDYVRANTQPTDYVAVLPEERLINFLSERRFPTRDPGVGPFWLARPEDEARFVAELDARRPTVIVLSKRHYREFGAGSLGDYNPLVKAHIDRTYMPVFRRGPYVVLRRRPRA
jgi:hypothetical protein